ncbi:MULTISPECIES: BTAD domain-containing putative transcriptional regulator [unclassified Crossiella]|uniref:BTAD domain-containing putative transcriptional regulator n=1 Tax=unclassified Crossiella TaxID=2620835 RepID=UPI001FFFB269|nr:MULTISPECIES: BTAD domain-containing putative transcriptional regulator [unclassified Crossiella]MCK2244614.1 tetratricopeptide repeat protein [Crossiella sp. S99.2]MCK2258399.1 tetratricopeptide repeat protein [Crossiella sp. S99.1]
MALVPRIEIALLGSFRVRVDGRDVVLSSDRQRVLLAALALEVGRTVPADSLVAEVWRGAELPASAKGAVQTYVMRLRRVLGQHVIATDSHGYRLELPAEAVDVARFTRLAEQAAEQGPALARQLLTRALTEWRGEPHLLAPGRRQALGERRLAAEERLAELDLAEQRLTGLPERLRGLLGGHPLRESLWLLLIRALVAAGRGAEALAEYAACRALLAEELGVEPGPALRGLHLSLLAGTPAVRTLVPRQLPADIRHFAGRTAELAALEDLLGPPDRRVGTMVVIEGSAGVGKTALAVHWGHRIAGQFPDGQLYLDLDGHGDTGPMSAASALEVLLRALSVRSADIPGTLPERVALLRTVLARRQVFLLLDNAQDAEQIRPLAPIPGCLVVLTARVPLPGLSATAGAHRITLGGLSRTEALGLLRHGLGEHRLRTDPQAVEQLIDRSGGLPLALVLAGARAARFPDRPLAELIEDHARFELPGGRPRPATTPAQLPAPPSLFTGRGAELARLDQVLTPGGTVAVSAVGGIGGVGKTALTLHWAHANLAAFPDGQLHVNLCGFDPIAQPMPPAVALRGFLDALGVPAAAVPVDEHAQAALYRSLVAGRRLLIVLDNARDADHVRPLLPGSPACTVVITSRHRLDGLLATHGVRTLPMDVLTEPDAQHLLARYLGADRVAAEPQAVAELLARCARLPLALGIVAARAATHPGFPLAALAEELRDEDTRLDALDSGEPASNLRTVFATTYQVLSAGAVNLAGLLALAPGPDLGLPAAAVLAGAGEPTVRARLRELAAVHLVQEHVPGRYRMHDLVRRYAAEHAGAAEEALRRLLAHYQDQVGKFLSPALLPEVANLVAATTHAARQGWLPGLPGLVRGVLRMLDALGHYDTALSLGRLVLDLGDAELTAVTSACLGLTYWHLNRFAESATRFQRAVDHARAVGDRPAEAEGLCGLGLTHWRLAEYEQALAEFEQALKIGSDFDNAYLCANAHLGAGFVHHWMGDYQRALEHHQATVEIARVAGGVDSLEWNGLNGMGIALVRLGRAEEGRQRLAESLALSTAAGDRYTTGSDLFCLGFALQALGEAAAAVEHHQRSLVIAVEIGDTLHQVRALQGLGASYEQLGEPDQAAGYRARARELVDQCGFPLAETTTLWAVAPPG